MALTARFDDALAYAAEVHRGDRRKGIAVPYVSHLLAVASVVIEYGGDETTAIAALLHDAAEDHGGEEQLRTIRERFGAEVAAIVEECSDSLLAEGAAKEDWHVRKTRYVAAVAHKSPRGRLVSAADKLHNARSILSDARTSLDVFARFNVQDPRKTVWYYRALADALGDPALAPFGDASAQQRYTVLVRDLDLVVAELERLVAGKHAIETEVKWRLRDEAHAGELRAALEAHGALRGRVDVEENTLFDRDGVIDPAGAMLRIRTFRARDAALVTWKGVATMDGAVKSREEIEIDAYGDVALLLARAGFAAGVRYAKTRQTWLLDIGSAPGLRSGSRSVTVQIDALPFGWFAEIEGEHADIEPAAVMLGLADSDREPRSYPDLMREYGAA